jgi:hypothetical protein
LTLRIARSIEITMNPTNPAITKMMTGSSRLINRFREF